MNRIHRYFLLSLATCLVLAGCGGDSQKKAASDLVADVSKVNDILDGVSDTSTANAAVPKIDAITADVQQVKQRLAKLPAPTAAENDSIRAEVSPAMQREKSRSDANLQRLRDKPEVIMIIAPPMQRMSMAVWELQFASTRLPKPFQPTPNPTPPGVVQTNPRAGPPTPPVHRGADHPPTQAQDSIRRSMDRTAQTMAARYGDGQVARIEMTNVPFGYNRAKLSAHLREISGAAEAPIHGMGDWLIIALAPVPDVSALATKIDFGKVTSVDAQKRLITVETNPNGP